MTTVVISCCCGGLPRTARYIVVVQENRGLVAPVLSEGVVVVGENCLDQSLVPWRWLEWPRVW